VRLQHVSIVIPPGAEAPAREFYGGLLGLAERPPGEGLDPSTVIWFETGPGLELHLMLRDERIEGNERRHFCLEVDDLDAMWQRLDEAGVQLSEATPIVYRPRFFCRDPFGNLIELTHIEA
jgi:catechol 2,3-dioxygenase-like lactoylglutathione lyase family enzyme